MIQDIIQYPDVPSLSHTIQKENETFWLTSDGSVGITYKGKIIDVEAVDGDAYHAQMVSLLKELHPELLIRFHAHSQVRNDLPFECSRSEAIAEKGYVQHQLLISCELKPPFGLKRIFKNISFTKLKQNQSKIDRLSSMIPRESLKRLGFLKLKNHSIESLGEEEIRDYFSFDRKPITCVGSQLRWQNEFVSVIRIWRGSEQGYDLDIIPRIKCELPLPIDMIASVQRVDQVWAELFLKRKKKSLEGGLDFFRAKKSSETDEAISQLLERQNALMQVEYQFVLRRESEQELRSAEAALLERVKPLGDVMIETMGLPASFIATLPGAEPHFRYFESAEALSAIVPIFAQGEANDLTDVKQNSLVLHRFDGSLHFFDPFDRGFDGTNILINGRKGSGKGVLANLISEVALRDPTLHMIKIDVGGSYVKECELFGGNRIEFELDQPSGLNPFKALKNLRPEHQKAIVQVITNFIYELIKERNELSLTEEVEAEIDKTVLRYAVLNRPNPTLSDFIEHSQDIPKKKVLERWTTGIFENAFKSRDHTDPFNDSRYQYINFRNIQDGTNPTYVKGIVASAMAMINLKMIECGDAKTQSNKKMMVFVDESPFFMKQNGEYFRFMVKNFRKYGHSTLLISQSTKDFELPTLAGGVDIEILKNSSVRFFYQVDGTYEEFKQRFGLTDEHLAKIHHLYRGKEYRECFLQTSQESKALKIAVTPEEFWRVTSDRSDNEKLYQLKSQLSWLSLREAIHILALERRKKEVS